MFYCKNVIQLYRAKFKNIEATELAKQKIIEEESKR